MDNQYSSVDAWLDSTSKTSRPNLYKLLQAHPGAKIRQSPPAGGIKWQDTITLTLVDDVKGKKMIGWCSSQIVKQYISKSKPDVKTEIFVESWASADYILSMLDAGDVADERHHTPRPHNERGAGRKPLNYTMQRKISELILDGYSIRGAAKVLGISTSTVAKYAKILISEH